MPDGQCSRSRSTWQGAPSERTGTARIGDAGHDNGTEREARSAPIATSRSIATCGSKSADKCRRRPLRGSGSWCPSSAITIVGDGRTTLTAFAESHLDYTAPYHSSPPPVVASDSRPIERQVLGVLEQGLRSARRHRDCRRRAAHRSGRERDRARPLVAAHVSGGLVAYQTWSWMRAETPWLSGLRGVTHHGHTRRPLQCGNRLVEHGRRSLGTRCVRGRATRCGGCRGQCGGGLEGD